jgi:hypothetical protein
MGKGTILERIKNVVYLIIKPIYLWSIGCKTMEEYLTRIEEEYELSKRRI